jgi:hypothetical protein
MFMTGIVHKGAITSFFLFACEFFVYGFSLEYKIMPFH